MSSDDEFGGLLDRESVLADGVPARRANTALFLIENRTAKLMAQSRQAADPYRSQAVAEERDLAFLEAFALGNEPPLRPKIQDLERYAPEWSSLVPRIQEFRRPSRIAWERSTSSFGNRCPV